MSGGQFERPDFVIKIFVIMSCFSNTEVCTPLIKLFCLTEAKSGIFDEKSGTRPEKAGRMVTLQMVSQFELLQMPTKWEHKPFVEQMFWFLGATS